MNRQLRTLGASELRERLKKSKLLSSGKDFISDDSLTHPPCSKCKRRLICRGCDKLLCSDCGYILQCQRCLMGWPAERVGYPADKSTQYYARDTGRKDENTDGQVIAELQEKVDSLLDKLAKSNAALKTEKKSRTQLELCVASLIDSRLQSLVAVDHAKKEVQRLQLVLTRTIVHHSQTMQQLLGDGSVVNCKPTFQAWRRLTQDNRVFSKIKKVEKVNAEQDALLVYAEEKRKSLRDEVEAQANVIYLLRSKLRRAGRSRLTALFSDLHSTHACFSAWRGFRQPRMCRVYKGSTTVIDVGESQRRLAEAHACIAVKSEECDKLKAEVDRLRREAVAAHVSWLQGDQVRILQAEIRRMSSRSST